MSWSVQPTINGVTTRGVITRDKHVTPLLKIDFSMIDGMLFPLAFAPSQNSEDYFTRKGNYAIFVMIWQKLPGWRWGGPSMCMTIGYGPPAMSICQRISILVTRSFYLMTWHSLRPQSWFLPLKTALLEHVVHLPKSQYLSKMSSP